MNKSQAIMLKTITEATLEAMHTHGGGFIKSLADTLSKADPMNVHRMLTAFPEIELHYGPKSQFQKQLTKQ